jgi:predicted TIM-barrel fold metal-dependent hydrolase
VNAGAETPVIDAAVFHNAASDQEVLELVAPEWREYLTEEIRIAARQRRTVSILAPFQTWALTSPLGEKLADAYPAGGGPPGSDLGIIRRQHLDPNRIARAVLCHDVAMPMPGYFNFDLAVAITTGVNRWLFERFLPDREFVSGLILAQTQSPELAAAEIMSFGRHPRCAGVLLGANGLGRPFGHRLYMPIFSAAAEMDLPVVIIAGGDLSATVTTQPVAGGTASFYSDYHTLTSQSLMTHAVSLICHGVFDRLPDLRVLLLGGGVAWITPFLSQFATSYKQFRRDTPWLRRAPADYFFDNVRVATYPLDRTDAPERLWKYLGESSGLDRVLCYASGYPNWDRDTVDDIRSWLPPAWLPAVLHDNAERLFRWR